MSLMCDEGNPRASSAYRLRSCVSHTLAHDLRATGNLSSQRLRAIVRNPDLGQEAARIELCEHRGVDLVRLHPRFRNQPDLEFATTTRATCIRTAFTMAAVLPVASSTT